MEKDATFEFFKDIPKDKSVTEEALAYGRDFNEHKGLIPAAAMPSMLGVSRQRWHVIKKSYKFHMLFYCSLFLRIVDEDVVLAQQGNLAFCF